MCFGDPYVNDFEWKNNYLPSANKVITQILSCGGDRYLVCSILLRTNQLFKPCVPESLFPHENAQRESRMCEEKSGFFTKDL